MIRSTLWKIQRRRTGPNRLLGRWIMKVLGKELSYRENQGDKELESGRIKKRSGLRW